MGVLLATDHVDNVDISTIAEVLNFTYVDSVPALVLVRLIVGSNGSYGVVGNGYYNAKIFVNGAEVLPEFPIAVGAVTTFAAQTKTIVLIDGDVVSVKLLGLPADTNISCISHIVDIGAASELSDSDINRISVIVANSLSNLTINPERAVLAAQPKNVSKERVILGPIKACVKTFLLPSGD